MNKTLEAKLKTLPRSPGVYFHKAANGEIIYVGKAAILKNRVRQYFQATRDLDIKTLALVAEIHDTDWLETESEIDALFLESEMVKRYMPRYNILLRDDKSQMFIRIDMKSEWPHVAFTRNPADDAAEYFGPYYNGFAIKKALRYLRKVFPYFTKPPSGDRPDLDVHLGLSPGPNVTPAEYKTNLRRLIRYFKGERVALVRELERDMKAAAKRHDFETAASLRNRLNNLRELQRRIMFGDKEFLNISKDKALADLRELLGLEKIPSRIEGYDISHMSGTNVVASMVVFTNGVSDRTNYRKFKTRIEHNNDFYNMNETMTRRLSEKNLKSWGVPDLVVIDGGKGQLDAALQARNIREQNSIPFIGLAKREEQIVIKHQTSDASSSLLPSSTSISHQTRQRQVTPDDSSLSSAELALLRQSSTSQELSSGVTGPAHSGVSLEDGERSTIPSTSSTLSSPSITSVSKYLQPEREPTSGPDLTPGAKPFANRGNSRGEQEVKLGAGPSNISRIVIDKQKLQELDGYVTVTEDYTLINLPHSSHIVKLLQRIRDESHRFAVSYHTVLKRQKQTASTLEEIPGIGPSTRKKLIRTFGSMRAVQAASQEQLIIAVGQSRAALIERYLPSK